MTPKALVIVESPAKIKTLGEILGRDYTVKASFGHVRDMPARGLGVDLANGFQPRYLVLKQARSLIAELKRSLGSFHTVYLAMDPDREGEAIAWHLLQVLRPKIGVFRVTFNAITPSAVRAAFQNARLIDLDLVAAQEVRRVLDRLVGYTVSPLLWNAIEGKGLSAGRVQSVALRVVVERHREIAAFVPEEYWSLTARFQAAQGVFEANLIQWQGQPPDLKTEAQAKAIIDALQPDRFVISDLQQRDRARKPPAPFTTSTLQQAASAQLHLSPSQTMKLAQTLYEAGQITYLRTDSVTISPEGQQLARDYIQQQPHLGPAYLPDKPHKFPAKAAAQEGHEAIRPTEVALTDLPEDAEKKLAHLYCLIWSRFVASQMAAAVYAETVVTVRPSSQPALFQAKGRTLIFDGWTRVYRVDDDQEEKEPNTPLPPLQTGEALTIAQWLPRQHWSQPSKRYTEASLIQRLDAIGVGRPSTYAEIVETIKSRHYVTVKKKMLDPTPRGLAVNDFLVAKFDPFFSPDFTRDMEAGLDQIANRQLPGQEFLAAFWAGFEAALRDAGWSAAAEDEVKEVQCPQCGQPMLLRSGPHGSFYGCSGYPKCKRTLPMAELPGRHPEEQK